MQTVLIVIHLLVVLALIGVVLLQKSEGGGLGIGGGGGGFMTSRGSSNVLTRATAILAAVFFATSLLLSILAGWGRQDRSILSTPQPGQSTPGAGFISSRQGEIPFFDETAVNRIRSDIKRYHGPERQTLQQEAEFSARLFLAVAQENDVATDCLDNDLTCFKTLEKGFLESLVDADQAGFSQKAPSGEIWREDPGARLTEQRIRAWATLALADAKLPEMLITTSSAVIDALLEIRDDALNLEKRVSLRLAIPPADGAPVLGPLLADLATRDTLSAADLAVFSAPGAEAAAAPAVTATLFVAANQHPASVIRRLAPATVALSEARQAPEALRRTLIVLVQG